MRVRHKSVARVAFAILPLVCVAGFARADDVRPTYTLYGTPGLIDMPTAQSAPDAELAFTIGGFEQQFRSSLTFQVTPRLSGTFRYSGFKEYSGPGTPDYFDRSFDLRYRFVDEGRYMPAVAVGLQDFIGTGRYSAEYLVASKTVAEDFTVTAGIGWGRLGSYNGFKNPLGVIDAAFETRPDDSIITGGTILSGQFFRGDAALFGGVEWRARDNLTFKMEYSSDAYARETTVGVFNHASPLNFGVSYRPRPGYEIGLSYLYGTQLGLNVTVDLNPKERPSYGGLEQSPVPVSVRGADARAAATWDRTALPDATLTQVLGQALAVEGQRLISAEVTDRTIRLRYANDRYRAQAQAMGRIARILTAALPPSIETFVLEPMQNGVPVSSVTLRRSDLEALENEPDAAALSYGRATVAAAAPGNAGLSTVDTDHKALTWSLSPYVALSLFDGNAPLRGDVGLELAARYELRPNLFLSGAIRKRAFGNNDEVGSISPSTLPPVRRNVGVYSAEGDPSLDYLTLAWYGHPARNIYTRATVGYLERMYAGLSTEVLWKPVNQRLAFGAELNYVAQRDPANPFALLTDGTSYKDPGGAPYFPYDSYNVVTGRVSAYYAFGNGFHGQVDVGRYLAGDWGATFTLDREFTNGWRVGGYFTLTDVSFEDFGEGSFDKGIRLTIPLDWALGQPSTQLASSTLTSLSRDGGAQLNVDGRLYEVVRSGQDGDLNNGWGRFWR